MGDVDLGDVPNNKQLILSINRFERKKNVKLAIDAFAELKKLVDSNIWANIHLVVAGICLVSVSGLCDANLYDMCALRAILVSAYSMRVSGKKIKVRKIKVIYHFSLICYYRRI